MGTITRNPLLQYEPVVSHCIYNFLPLSSSGRQLLASSKKFHEPYFSYLSATQKEIPPSDMVFLMSLRTRVLSLNSSQELCLITKSDLFIGATLAARAWKHLSYYFGYHDYCVSEAIKRRYERETRTIGMLVTPAMWDPIEPVEPPPSLMGRLVQKIFMDETTLLKSRANVDLLYAGPYWSEWTRDGIHPGTFEQWQRDHLLHSLDRLVEQSPEKTLQKRTLLLQPSKEWYRYVGESNDLNQHPHWQKAHLLGILDGLVHLEAYTELSQQLDQQTYRVMRFVKFLANGFFDVVAGLSTRFNRLIAYLLRSPPPEEVFTRRYFKVTFAAFVVQILVQTLIISLLGKTALASIVMLIYVIGSWCLQMRLILFSKVPERESFFKSDRYTITANPDAPPIKRRIQLREDVMTHFISPHHTTIDSDLCDTTARNVFKLMDFEKL